MFNQISKANFSLKMSLLGLCLASSIVAGCSVAAKENDADALVATTESAAEQNNSLAAPNNLTKNSHLKGRIQITPNSPADAVRTFYKNLREKRFREAMLMTNLRPAVEPLTADDMQDLNTDFEPLARQVPADVQINGEVVTGNSAAVTAKMPNTETGALEDKIFNLRRENENWVILTSDEKSEALAKKQGRNYFFAMRIEIHQNEAQMMLERISKAQAVYALQNDKSFADMPTLIAQGLLAADAQTTESTGYRFAITLSPDKKKYFATADPAVYGKTGKFSFLLETESADKQGQLKSKDNKGASLKK